VLLDLAAPPPRIAAAAADLRRLIVFLVRNAAAAAPEGAVAVRTRREGDRALLVVEDTGPSVAADWLPTFFEPGAEARGGADALELAACHGLARRLGGRAAAANPAGGGVAVTVELPAV
jgi:C4-dicarboxylate-specific signal transduction histidine kinase